MCFRYSDGVITLLEEAKFLGLGFICNMFTTEFTKFDCRIQIMLLLTESTVRPPTNIISNAACQTILTHSHNQNMFKYVQTIHIKTTTLSNFEYQCGNPVSHPDLMANALPNSRIQGFLFITLLQG